MYIAMDSKPNQDDRWEAQLRKGCLDLVILAVLWNERLYGLEILRRLEHTAGLDLAEGTLYPILMRLKQEGLLESTWVEAETGHPRKYYRLTRAGRQRTSTMCQSWEEFSQGISRLLKPIKEADR
jgi:PadR family transcriptional regulator PadR